MNKLKIKYKKIPKTFYAGGFLYDPETKSVLLMHRDNKTDFCPNQWGILGGLNKGIEKPEECFIRELEEEIGLRIEEHEVNFLVEYLVKELNTYRYTFFVVNNQDKSKFTLGEGRDFDWIPLDKVFEYNLCPRTRKDLGLFVENFEKGIINNYSFKQKLLIQELKKELTGDNYNKSTIVEMMDDYENDKVVGLTSLVFPSEKIIKVIESIIITPLRQIEPVHYYYTRETLHITIKNVKTISPPSQYNNEDINNAKIAFGKVLKNKDSFIIKIAGITIFPTSLSLMGYSGKEFHNIVVELDTALKEAGVPDNKKYIRDDVFFHNITFCRFQRPPSEKFIKKVKELENIEIGSMQVKKIVLLECNIVCSKKSRRIIAEYDLK